MKATRLDETTIILQLKMSADEAENLRNLMMRVQQLATLRADESEMLGTIVDSIGRVF